MLEADEYDQTYLYLDKDKEKSFNLYSHEYRMNEIV